MNNPTFQEEDVNQGMDWSLFVDLCEGNLGSLGPSSSQNSFPTVSSLVSTTKDTPSKGESLRGTVGSLEGSLVCSAKDNVTKGGLQGTVGSLSLKQRRANRAQRVHLFGTLTTPRKRKPWEKTHKIGRPLSAHLEPKQYLFGQKQYHESIRDVLLDEILHQMLKDMSDELDQYAGELCDMEMDKCLTTTIEDMFLLAWDPSPSMEGSFVCSAKDNVNKGGSQGTVGSLEDKEDPWFVCDETDPMYYFL